MKNSRFLHSSDIDKSKLFKAGMCIFLESLLFSIFVVIYSKIGILNEVYIEDTPIIGSIISTISPDATAGHLIAGVLALFSVVIPVTIFMEAFEHRVFDNPQQWLSERNNQVILTLVCVVIFLIIFLETASLYTAIAKEAIPTEVFSDEEQVETFMTFLAQNKGYAICVSAVLAVINLAMSFFTAYTFHSLKHTGE